MQIAETYQLTMWIQREIQEAQIVQKYNELFKVLNANAQRQNNQPAQPFEDQKNALIDAITSINVNLLTLSQLQVLKTLKISPHIGNQGEKSLNDILSNTLDIAHVAEQINMKKKEVQQGITQSGQLQAALAPIIDEEEPEIAPDQVLTRIIFEHEASVKNINELKDWSSKWFDIGRGFAIANGQTPEDVQVIGGARGSLIIELALLATTALPIAKAINLTLDSMVKYKDYQQRATEVRRLKEETSSLAEDFEEDAKRWESRALQLKEEVAEEISVEVQQHFTDYRQENQAELRKAVQTLVDFISKGGDVDCVISEEAQSEDTPEDLTETMRLLKADFSNIREIKDTLLLTHKPEDKTKETL